MAKRINISISDELYDWISLQAENQGIPISTYGTIVLNRGYSSISNEKVFLESFKNFGELTSDDIQKLLASENINKITED